MTAERLGLWLRRDEVDRRRLALTTRIDERAPKGPSLRISGGPEGDRTPDQFHAKEAA